MRVLAYWPSAKRNFRSLISRSYKNGSTVEKEKKKKRKTLAD